MRHGEAIRRGAPRQSVRTYPGKEVSKVTERRVASHTRRSFVIILAFKARRIQLVANSKTSMPMTEPASEIGLGVIGCGGFGLFALQQFVQIPGIRLAGMAGTARQAARAAADRYGLDDLVDVERLLELPSVEVVYIATPPFLHYSQAKQALAAGKHVVCEKPLALTMDQADELLSLSRKQDRLLVANQMQRYNDLFGIVRHLVDAQPLGSLLHGYFENYASDEHLPAEHWFWDRQKSGGIFVEHGVHFFDLVAGWLGLGDVVAAQASCRDESQCEDQVLCTVRYSNNVYFNFYHGFHQPGRLDRQELRLVFERGDVLLQGWIPTSARVYGVTNESDMRRLVDLFPGSRVDAIATYGEGDRVCVGHGRRYDVYQQFTLHWGEERQKLPVYCELLRRLMSDQVAWIRDRSHVRTVSEKNAHDALAVALAADDMAHR
jgi:predicted dehydrogenase